LKRDAQLVDIPLEAARIEHLRCRVAVVSGISLPADKSAELPFQTVNNLIVLRGSINGSKPLSLLLDTGACGSVINESRPKNSV
jgi:hypothetical protein